MEDLESECLPVLKSKHNCIPKSYFRYVDDTFLIINKNDVDLVVNMFNSYDDNLKFTCEIEKDCRISFLDVVDNKFVRIFSLIKFLIMLTANA